MNKIKNALIITALLSAMPLLAQQRQRLSPHETTGAMIDGNRVTIVYGRPYTKERKIWGDLVPFEKIWRTGADEATLLITQQPIEIGGTTVPAGAYTLWTLPKADSAKLMINKQIGQWGINPRDPKKVYDEKLNVAEVDLKKDALDTPVDQFTMAVAKNSSGGGIIKMSWENTQYSVPFTVQKSQ